MTSDEAIILADRVCVMAARPGRIIRDIPSLPRPALINDLLTSEFWASRADHGRDARRALRFT